jgi:hypothetical protein
MDDGSTWPQDLEVVIGNADQSKYCYQQWRAIGWVYTAMRRVCFAPGQQEPSQWKYRDGRADSRVLTNVNQITLSKTCHPGQQ